MPGRDDVRDRIRALFVAELDDGVRLLNGRLVALDRGEIEGDPAEAVHELFRIAHNLKGAAQAAGLDDARDVARELESGIAAVRDGVEPLSRPVIARLLAHVDVLERIHHAVVGAAASDARSDAPPSRAAPRARSVRVTSANLDALVGLSSELLELVGRLMAAVDAADAESHRDARQSEVIGSSSTPTGRLLRELRRVGDAVASATFALSFQPFGEACTGLERTARDLAVASGKEVELRVEGEDIEIDGTVLSVLREVLRHLVRNAIDHGIEVVADRISAGKPVVGRVVVSARLRGSRLEVVVRDDGRGIDEDRVRSAAARLQNGDSRARVAELVFLPGVTTAQRVTDTSGRGVGLDAVRTRIASIGGTVDLESRQGAGTSVAMSMPVTVALQRVLTVRCGEHRVCVPLEGVHRMEKVSDDPAAHASSIVIDGRPVPLQPLAAVIGLGESSAEAPTSRLALVTATEPIAALGVDEVDGDVTVVVKPVPRRLAALDVFVGVASLPSGDAAFVVNPASCAARVAQHQWGVTPSRRRAIAADDSATARRHTASLLEQCGYTVMTAADGRAAWALLEQHGSDILVTDVEMPHMDGIELCRRARDAPALEGLRIILVSSHDSPEDRSRGLAAGADAYIAKSELDRTTLLAALGARP